MQHFKRSRSRKGAGSEQRKALRLAVWEGIPATLVGNMLGGPILTAYLLFLGATSQQIGLVLAIPPLANIVQIAAAFLMQRMENRKFWMALLGTLHRSTWVATGAIPFLMPDRLQVPVFIALFLFSFLNASVGGVVWSSMISDMVPAQVRGRYFGIRNTIHFAFAGLSLLVAGQILESAPSERYGFVILYAIAGAAAVWNAIEIFRYPNPPFEKSAEPGGIGQFFKPLKDRAFMMATAFIALFILLLNIAVPLFSFVMLELLHISKFQVTLVTAVQMIVMMVSYYYWGNLNARFETITLLLWSLPLLALSCVLWVGLEALPVLLVLILVHVALGIGQGGYNLLTFNFLIGDTPKADRPMYIGIFAGVTGLAGFIGPMVGGALYEQIKGGAFWLQSYGVSLFTGAALLVLALGVGPFVLTRSKKRKGTGSQSKEVISG
ncbi:MFS transporter [Paenibacillus darwinianus]|uniref:MFS transporter n=1 Tax=Paenibacillus darwinianus TaxID=1380763 RepID=A0A9W5S3L9_9BACL|nr:MFS transporter [Paenibacillus darwinianus]EXX91429.1 MFS transporter [Paenibacillus darwinianus]EXX92245.1 MFS transporter [Paenibacillus darwinianus]